MQILRRAIQKYTKIFLETCKYHAELDGNIRNTMEICKYYAEPRENMHKSMQSVLNTPQSHVKIHPNTEQSYLKIHENIIGDVQISFRTM